MGMFSLLVTFPLFIFFCLNGVWRKPFVFTQATTICIFSGCHSQNVLIEIQFVHPGMSKKNKTRKSPHLGYIHLPFIDFCCCLLLLLNWCLVPLNIFEKRNVHQCLQYPPHWNTWGKVSSLTLWSNPSPQLEPQHLVFLPIFLFLMMGNFSLILHKRFL